VCPLAGVRGAAFDDPRFEPERLRAAARAVLGPLEQVRSDDELVALWRERFERWLPVGSRRWRLPGVTGGWGADVVIRELEVVALRRRESRVRFIGAADVTTVHTQCRGCRSARRASASRGMKLRS
jgi:hypothetical protein